MSQTTTEKLTLERQLQRIERANPDHFRFPREMPRQQRRIPFVDDRRALIELRDAAIRRVLSRWADETARERLDKVRREAEEDAVALAWED